MGFKQNKWRNGGTIAYVMLMLSCVSTPLRVPKKTPQSLVSGRVIIDPGHGGHDTGASHNGLKEKDLTLDLARRIQRLMGKVMPRVEVILTRRDDRYVGLEERVSIAQKHGGDVFLSLHINSGEASASGYELFSLDVASNAHADKLAARENKSGASDSAIKFILADLRATAFREESDELAALMAKGLNHQLKHVRPVTEIRDRGYNQALFRVLFVRMPAILAEMFFLSNPNDAALLRQKNLRELSARGLVLGIMKFMENKVIRAQK